MPFFKNSLRNKQLGANHFFFWGGRGGGEELVLDKNFFPETLVIEFFSWNTRAVKDIFFQCRNLFPQVFPCNNFFPSKSVCKILFSEITHTRPPPSKKSQMVGHLVGFRTWKRGWFMGYSYHQINGILLAPSNKISASWLWRISRGIRAN